MPRLLVLLLALLASACAYTGHELRDAGAGGTADPPRTMPDQQDPRFEGPVRAGRTTVR